MSNQLLSMQETVGEKRLATLDEGAKPLATPREGPSAVDEGPSIDAWVRLLRGHAGMRRAVSAQLQAEHGLTVNEYETLLLLARAPDRHMRRVDLADSLQLTPSGITRLLDGLRERGLVDKASCARDARVSYAVLTEPGHAKLVAASCSHLGAIRALFEERYSERELETLIELLGRLPGAASCDESGCDPDGGGSGCAP
jgi:DNA-binding MarR family transcriptional regulator